MSSEKLSNSDFWEYYDTIKKSSDKRNPEKFLEIYNKHTQRIKTLSSDKFLGQHDKGDDTVRFVVISDTHCREICTDIPDGDVLLHCGDFTMRSRKTEFEKFNKWIGTLPHPTKITIAGNHDRLLEERPLNQFFQVMGASERQELLDILTNVTYIQDETITVHGYNIYGSPWTPVHLGGFQKQRGPKIMQVWDKIPDDTDILMTHGPPACCGDMARNGPAGCVNLLHTIQRRVKPLYSCYGHIHEGNGVYTDGVTTFINAALCDCSYRAQQNAYVVDLPVKETNGAPE